MLRKLIYLPAVAMLLTSSGCDNEAVDIVGLSLEFTMAILQVVGVL